MKRVELSDVTLDVCDEGSGLPVLFVHGFPLDRRMWQPQVEAFSPKCRTIAPDLRGFGRSGVTPGLVSMEHHARDLAALLNAMNIEDPVVVVGLSMGGYIAFEFLKNFPTRVAGLVLASTKATADPPEAKAGRLDMADRVLSDGVDFLPEAMLGKLLAEDCGEPIRQQVREMMLSGQSEGIAAAQRGMAERADSTELLSTIDVPTLLIAGEEDPLSPPSLMEEMRAQIAGARLIALMGAAHISPLERPEAFNAALETLLSEVTQRTVS